MAYGKYGKSPERGYGKKLEYKKYRVKSPIKSFRDFEVYKITTQLAVEIFQIEFPKEAKIYEKEIDILKDLAKPIPKLIAESYGDRFTSLSLALGKLERAGVGHSFHEFDEAVKDYTEYLKNKECL